MRPGITLAALLLPWPVVAQQPTESTPPPPPADFSDGLARLAALGLPEMKGATWVKAPKEAPGLIPQSSGFRDLNVKLHGGAWKLPGDTPQFIGLGTTKPISPKETPAEAPAPSSKPSLLDKMLRNHAASKPPAQPQPKPDISVEEDVQRIIDALGDKTSTDRLIERMEYDQSIITIPAHCLIFAAQLHATGHTDSANRLAAAVFTTFPDATQSIDAAVATFASTEFLDANETFFAKHDWKAYRDTLKALLEKYPRGWEDASGVALLIPSLDKRAAGEAPPAPSLPGITLKPEAIALLGKLLEAQAAPDDSSMQLPGGLNLSEVPPEHRARILAMMRDQNPAMTIGNSREGIWLLPEETDEEDEDSQENEPVTLSPVEELQNMGMDGLVAFAAVAEDPTLVPVRNSSFRSRSFFSRNRDTSPQAIYDQLDRPRSRGEIACSVLSSTLPRPEDGEQLDPASLREAAIDFWKNHREKSTIELALLFAREGDQNQRQESSYYLSRQKNPESRQAFEKLVLTSEQPSSYSSVIESYLELRKTEAREFFDAYSKVLTTELEGVDLDEVRSSGLYHISQAGSVEKYLKKLSIKVGAVSLEELIKEALEQPAAEGQRGRNPAMASLSSAFQGVEIADCLKAIATAAPKATPDQWLDLNQILLSRIYRNRENYGEEFAPEPVKLPTEVLEAWRPLLAKTDPLPPKHQFTPWVKGYGGSTLADATLLILEASAFPASGNVYNPYLRLCDPPDNTVSFVRKRVTAWIDGKEPPPWPDAKQVPEARRNEITAKLTSLSAAEIPPFAKTLDLSERFAVADWMAKFTEETPPPAGILELRDQVVDLRPFNPGIPHDTAILADLGIAPGYKLDAEALVKLAEKLTTESTESSGYTISFYTAPMSLGLHATADRKNDATSFASDYYLQRHAQWFQRIQDADALAMVMNQRFSDFWTLKEGKVEAVPQDDADSSAIESLKNHFASKSLETPYIMVSVLTRADAEKLMRGESEEESEE